MQISKGVVRTGVVGLVVVLVGSLMPPVEAASRDTAAAGESFQLINANSGKCLVVQGSSAQYPPPAIQSDCDRHYADQAWIAQRSPRTGYYQLLSFFYGQCLAAQGYADGARAILVQCDDRYADQLWVIPSPFDPPSSFRITNLNSGRSLVVQGYDNGAPVFQYQNAPYLDQFWIWA